MLHKSSDSIVTEIKSWPKARSLTNKDVKTISRLVRRSSVPAGWAFIQAETPGDAAYLILTGTAEVHVSGKRVAELGPGDVTGEIAVERGGLRTATVTATTPCTFLHIEREDFQVLKKDAPEAHRLFVEYVEERVAALSA
jgi:CRP/FNR family cyclic AMP-dependent transcriptional regulator